MQNYLAYKEFLNILASLLIGYGHDTISFASVNNSGKIVFFYFSTKTYLVGTQKKNLNKMVILSTQYMLKLGNG